VIEVAVGRTPECRLMEARRMREAAADNHAVAVAERAVAGRTKDVEALLAALEKRHVDALGNICRTGRQIVLAGDGAGDRILDGGAVGQNPAGGVRVLSGHLGHLLLTGGEDEQKRERAMPRSHGPTSSMATAPEPSSTSRIAASASTGLGWRTRR